MAENINVKVIKVGDTIVIDDGYTATKIDVVTAVDKNEIYVGEGAGKKQVYESNIVSVNGEYWFRNLADFNVTIPGLEFVIKVWERGDYDGDQAKALFQSLKFMCSQAGLYRDNLIIGFNNQITTGIKGLAAEKVWPNLLSVSSYALDQVVDVCLKSNEGIEAEMADHYSLKLRFLKMGESEYRNFAAELLVLADKYDAKQADLNRNK